MTIRALSRIHRTVAYVLVPPMCGSTGEVFATLHLFDSAAGSRVFFLIRLVKKLSKC